MDQLFHTNERESGESVRTMNRNRQMGGHTGGMRKMRPNDEDVDPQLLVPKWSPVEHKIKDAPQFMCPAKINWPK